ncbi:two-component regulator propeller domain-containing protein [Thermophagus sp. OGC60D27]|uniref:two-component regulator propeller domain-containing protein n=1 Tax=Thermophagus sp. OGC60D27 TaxID=3458415 RepID=UPI004037B75C
MKTSHHQNFHLKIIGLLLLLGVSAKTAAYNFKTLSNKSGLSNSAVLSMCQDHQGYMWLGTCDGLNVYDGQSIQTFKPSSLSNSLSGNLIESLIETHDNIFWIQTNYGLNKLNRATGIIEYYDNFKEKNHLIKTNDNNFFVLLKNEIFYYIPSLNDFRKFSLNYNPADTILNVNIDSNNILWVFKSEGVDTYQIKFDNHEKVTFDPLKIFFHKTGLLFASHENDMVYFIDRNFDFFEYNLLNNTTRFITNLTTEISSKGEISSIVKHNNNFFIGFKTNGLIQLEPSLSRFGMYEKYELGIKSGIFCLLKDKFQDIVWVGTDGQGVYLCSSDPYTVKSITFNNFYDRISKPIRALYLDKESNLWIGTKGDGILKISNFSKNTTIIDEQISHFASSNSLLKNNSVYAFEKSKKDILWIGHDEGLNYYSYKERKIKDIHLNINNNPIRYIHSICELNDTTLWMASVGEGIFRAIVSGTPDDPHIKNVKQITIQDGEFSANYFFTLYKENDTILWFGNRGYGAYRINTNTMKLESMKFGTHNNNKTLDDVFSMNIDKNNNYWFGTSFGLVKLYQGNKQVFNENNGFPNNTIHGMLQDSNNNLWLSTNQGIIRFDTKLETFQIYNQNTGLEVIEFSDGAYFKDLNSGDLLFGGINGLVTISKNERISHEKYVPKILFNDLTIFGKKFNINDFYDESRNSIQLKYHQNFFSIKLTAIDFINSNNYSFYYKLEGLNDNWIENGKSNIVSFTNIPPGHYTLHTKFRNLISNVSSDVASLKITIVPPWYRKNIAFVIYFIVYALLVFFTFRLIKKWYRLKNMALEAKMNENKKEELYESKLQFFTNITHELCTPLALIQGPCEKILSYPKVDHQIKKYASLIKNNSGKLNALIQELIEFRRIDTDNKTIKVESLPISNLTEEIASSFSDMAESKNISFVYNIDKNITWNSDRSCYTKILNNLIANAFKYTNINGSVEINLSIEKDNLNLYVLNTGKGIKEEKIPLIFDRYKILDEFEGLNDGRFPSRNGLGLAICHSMTQLLGGNISVTSIPHKQTQFKVTLPQLEVNQENSDPATANDQRQPIPPLHATDVKSTIAFREQNKPKHQKSDSTVLIIDDDEEMLWFLSDLFSDSFNVIKMTSAVDALDYLGKYQVDLIITDILMQTLDGISFTKSIKQNKLLAHIPVILLSAVNSPDYQVKGIEAGADLYLSKPFNINYLLEIANRFLAREETLKDYYNSIFSSIELEEGNFLKKDDKDFFIKVLNSIESNITDPNLSAETISSLMGFSKRNLYRRLKQVTDKSVMELIKEYRFKKVEKLLISTKMSVDEIMFKTGFHNRGHFYKSFKQKYAKTPKEYRNFHQKSFENNKVD